MEKTVQQIPFLRPTALLAFGIYAGYTLRSGTVLFSAIAILLFILLVLINRKFSFKRVHLFGAGIHLLFFLIGMLAFNFHATEPHFFEKGISLATVLEKPQEKGNSYKSVVRIFAVRGNNTVLPTNEKVLAYFEKNERAKKLVPGQVIGFPVIPKIIKNYGNPFEFDYKKYLRQKKIYRQLYLPANEWKFMATVSSPTLKIKAELFREKLLEKYRHQKLGKREQEILSALTLGYKRDLDRKTKRLFSAAGTMHVLAVSGLHVGIVYFIIVFLFGFLRKQKTGRLFFVILTIVLLWVYAFITGLPPSVMRASTMFSLFVIGENISRKPNSYNSLAASAIFLLLLNPGNLFDVGFQLSYAAVFGILFLQPKLFLLFDTKNKIVKYCWALLTVSVAAQVTTLPITLFYFHQFPSYFWLANLVIIPAVTLLIILGIILLLVAKVPAIAGLVSTVIQFIIENCFVFLEKIEQLPYAVLKTTIQPIQLFSLIAIIATLFLYLSSFRAKFLKTGLFFVTVFLASLLAFQNEQNNTTEIIVYNSPGHPVVQLIKGKTNFVISESNPKPPANLFNMIENTTLNLNLKPPVVLNLCDTFTDKYLQLRNKIAIFEGKVILIEKDFSNLEKPIRADYVIDPKLYKNLKFMNRELTTLISTKKKLSKSEMKIPNIYCTSKSGAFTKKW